jgi:hypothetical protein
MARDNTHGLVQEDIKALLSSIGTASRPIPNTKRSKEYCLIHDGQHFPPKFVLIQAFLEAKRSRALPFPKMLRHLSGGPPTNDPLKTLGFDVQKCRCRNNIGHLVFTDTSSSAK